MSTPPSIPTPTVISTPTPNLTWTWLSGPPSAAQPTADITSTIAGVADYPQYGDVTELSRASSLVVTGRVIAAATSVQQPDPANLPANKVGSGAVDTPLTLRVERVVLHRDGPVPGASITIVQEGGVVDHRLFTVFGGPVLTVPGEYLLFLRWFSTAQPAGEYGVVGGGQGSYALSPSGQVRSMPESGAASGVLGDLDGQPLVDVVDAVQRSS